MSIFIAPAASASAAPPFSPAMRSPYAPLVPPRSPLSAPALSASPPAAAASAPWDAEAFAAAASAAAERPGGAARRVSQEALKGSLPFLWGRLAFASGVLLVILVAGFVAKGLKFDDWSTLMLHSFELLLGIFMGLLGGEISERSGGDRR